jgi:hypothetical protein
LRERLEARAQISGIASRPAAVARDRSEAEKRHDDKDKDRDKRDAGEN